MEPSTAVTICVILALFMCLTRVSMPGHKLSLYGTIEAFQHIAVGFVIAAICFVEGQARLAAIACLVIPTVLEVIMFARGPKRDG